MIHEDNGAKLLKTDTREWNSGLVKFAVIGWKDKPEKNYIVFEKHFLGKSRFQDQKFNLRVKDWDNLKKLIDGELPSITGWSNTVTVADQKDLEKLLQDDPDIFEKILSNKNVLKLSKTSFEALDRLGVKIYEIKSEKIDAILKSISEATAPDLEQFSTLLNELKLNQISMMTSLIYQKLKIIDLLEKVIMSENSIEDDVHQIFEKHPWLLGRSFEILSSDKTLSKYLNENLSEDPETKKRPDIIASIVPYSNDIVIVELKKPGIKLRAKHIGQVLEYKALVERYKPNVKKIDCFVFGYEKSTSFTSSNDAVIKTFSELIDELRNEYKEYQKVLEAGKIVEDFPF